MTPRRFCVHLLVISLPVLAPVAHAGELEELRATLTQMQRMLGEQQARIAQLEQKLEQKPDARPADLGGMPVASAAPAAPATTNLPTFYGKLDAFVEYDRGGSRGSRVALESGGMFGNRVGLKGSLDIRPDLQAVYQLEAGFFGNNGQLGQNSRVFGRQIYAGLQGSWGKFTAGRQYAPYFDAVTNFDAFDNGYGSPTNDGNMRTGPVRYDNSLRYQTPLYHGLTGVAFVALSNATGGVSRNAQGLSLDYQNGPFGFGVAYQNDDHIGDSASRIRYRFAGGSYQWGRVRWMAGVAGAQSQPDSGASTDWRSWYLGARVSVTATGELRLIYGEGHCCQRPLSDRGQVLSMAWMESLSPQTKAYLALSHHRNAPGSSLVPSGTSAYGSYTINPGESATGIALGVVLSF